MKFLAKKLIERLGYKLIKKKFMSSGIDLLHDISMDDNIEDINTVFDVGANTGQTLRLFADIFPRSTIYSFEPVYSSFRKLKKNNSHVENAKLFQIGFSDKKSRVKIYHQSDSGLNSIKKSINKPDINLDNSFEEITIDTIDSFCERNHINQIDLLKIDAEGMDLKVIKGAKALMKSHKIKYLLIETGFGVDNIRNTPYDDVNKYLTNRNYKLRGFFNQSNWEMFLTL